MINHPFTEDREVVLTGAGYPTLGYIAKQLGAIDGGMPEFVKDIRFHYSPDPGPYGSYTVIASFTKEAYPGQSRPIRYASQTAQAEAGEIRP